MNPKDLYYWTAQILTLDECPDGRKAIIASISGNKIPLENLIKLCDRNYIIPAIYLKLERHNLLSYFPDEYAGLLEHIYVLNKQRNQLILEQINQINQVLKKENILPVYLKGTAHLLDNLYSDTGERMMGDIDFLVSKKDFFKTAGLLLKMGYEKQYELYDNISNFIHYPPLYHASVPANVEIHRLPVVPEFAAQFSTDLVFSEKKKIRQKENCYVPSDTHKITHNFIHSQLSHRGYLYKSNSLRDLYDLYLLFLRRNSATFPALHCHKHRNKMRGYFAFATQVFHSNKTEKKCLTQDANRHVYICNLLLKYPLLKETLKQALDLFQTLLRHYPKRIKKLILQKKYRKYLLNKKKAFRPATFT